MSEQDSKGHLPNADRMSILAATILLAYTLARYISLPGREISIQFPGIYLDIKLNIQTLVVLLVAGLTASGADWLFREHPSIKKRNTIEHWLLPAMTTLVIAIPLFQVPQRPIWWVGFAMGGGLIILVLIAEYITIDPQDPRYPPAAAGITAISFALFLILIAALSYAETRLFLLLPVLIVSCMLLNLRVLRLRFHNEWLIIHSITVALITTQIATALHYWPISPIAYGLAILAPAYALTNFVSNLTEKESYGRAIVEPTVMLFILWAVAFWLR
jgi:hypothetical protein